MESKRIIWLDFARSAAIVSVVFMHCIESAYRMSFESVQNLSFISGLFRACGYTAGRIGVPIFFAITGWLLLERDYSTDKKILSFYKHNLLPLILTSEIWIVIYFIRSLIKSKNGLISDLICDMLFLKTPSMGHMWYIPAIIGIYIAIPFVSNAIKKLSDKTLLIPICVVLLFCYGSKLYNIFAEAYSWEITVSAKLELGFLGGVYGSYLLIGLLCRRGAFKKIPSIVLIIAAAVSFAFCVFIIITTVRHGYDYHLYYDFIGVFVCSTCIFELFSRFSFKSAAAQALGKVFTGLSLISFGMYFIHKPLLDDIREYVVAFGFPKYINTVLLFCVVFVLSAVIAFILSKIPKIKKWLLFIK